MKKNNEISLESMENSINMENSVCESDNSLAIVVRNATKSYEAGKIVLDDFNMSIPTGSIYGLLGASGSGKTTVLSCIIGLTSLDRGKIRVFNCKPGSPESGMPGIIGYMPQDVALYQVFTILEILQYFGRIYGMTSAQVFQRMEFLSVLIDLPESGTYVSTLSGGQQRRLSLAVAMLHKPSILVLDEPTVGVDPLLREKIWNYLKHIVETQKITCIVSTHYIEEASKHSNMIGIMRSGRLLVEQGPAELLEKYKTIYLEQVFLLLCKQDDQGILPKTQDYTTRKIKSVLAGKEEEKNVAGVSYYRRGSNICNIRTNNRGQPWRRDSTFLGKCKSHIQKTLSVVIKNYLALVRTPWFLFILLFIPPFQVLLLNTIIGHNPNRMAVGLVDEEVPVDMDLLSFCKTVEPGCFTNYTSCQFLNTFPENEFQWIVHPTDKKALESVQLGETWGFISIPKNYTQDLFDRYAFRQYMTNETLEGSTIKSRLDLSFSLKSDYARYKIYSHFQKFVTNIAESCKKDPRIAELPFKQQAIYGSLEPTFLRYIQPGQLIMIIMLVPMASSLHLISDRKAGTLQRSVVAGLKYFHTLGGFMITEGILIGIQVALCYGILVPILGEGPVGSLWQFLLLLFLVGFAGLSLGFLAGQAVDNGVHAFFLILAIYLPLMVTSGVTWPSESLPAVAKVIYTYQLSTLPVKSIRGIYNRGWGITHPKVWPGYLILVFWILVLCTLSAIIKKIRNK